MAKATKKVDVKKVEKEKVMAVVVAALEAAGYTVGEGTDYGFTSGTLVVRGEKCDVQLKPVTPKAGVERYAVLVDEDEAEAVDPEAVVADESELTLGLVSGTEQLGE